ncbi:hypothetical protein [uncultured Nostoc sp.]|uniref:hypothetical protein n=1 Tax=uncultured Nostoc sp. TaxID=340711 RepID=UPI0035CAEF08
MLQPNGVLAIPHFHAATELSHIANDALAPAHTLEFKVVFNNDSAKTTIRQTFSSKNQKTILLLKQGKISIKA